MTPRGFTICQPTHVDPPAPRRTPPHSVSIHVAPNGRLEDERSEAFRRCVALLSVVWGADVTVDLHGAPWMDDASARALADGQKRLRQHDGRLTVVCTRSQPREALLRSGVRAEVAEDRVAQLPSASGW